MNFFTVSGRVGNEPEFKTVGSNSISLLRFSMAFDAGYGDKKNTTWISVSLWGKRAESLKQYVRKGMPLTVGGEIQVRKWTGNDGKEGASLEMNCTQLTLPPKPKDEAGGPPPMNDDIPF